MYELENYDIDDDGAWETVSKNKKPKDKMKMDKKAAMTVKNTGANGVRTTSGAAGTRRQNKQGNSNMPGKKPAPLMNWREAAKKKAETTEKQKRALLKNVQIGRSVKNPPQPVNRKPMKSSAKKVGKGENKNPKDKEAGKEKLDYFQEYNESFPDLPRSESTEEEIATTIPSHPLQDLVNSLPPFYDLNGCDVSADVFRILNAAVMGGPGVQSLLDQPTLHEPTEFVPPLQEYQVGDGVIDGSGFMMGAVSSGGCTTEAGTLNGSLASSEVNARGGLREITCEELFNIPVDKGQPNIVESQVTGVIHQEFKVNNLPQDVSMRTRGDYQEKAVKDEKVFDEKKACAPVEKIQDPVPATGNENVPLKKVPMKRKKKVKVQTKDKDGGSAPDKTESQGNADKHAQINCKVKINGSAKEIIPGKNPTDRNRGNQLEKLPTKVNKSTNLVSDIASQVTTEVNDRQEIENKDLPIESASMDALTSAVANLNISKTDSRAAFKCDNQNNNCQEAANDDDESCLELNGLELKCIPDYFETISHVPNQTEQETEIKADATGQAEDSGMLRGHREEARRGKTPSLQETTEKKETVETKEVQTELQNDTPNSEDKGNIETTEADGGGGHTQQMQGIDSNENEDDAQEDALRMCQPFNDTCQNAGPEERQDKCSEVQRNPEESVVERKVTYGDVIEYVMEQLKELYSGEEVDGFNPVIKIEHEPLPDELTRHLTLLRQLSYNYTPSLHPYDTERRRFSESSDSDWSDSFDNSYEVIEDKTDERSGPVKKDDEQMPLRWFHKKLQMFAQLNHLHQIVSNPRLGVLLEDWHLRGSTEQLFNDSSDLFPDLMKGSKPRDQFVLENSACDVTEKCSPCDMNSPLEKGRQRNAPILSFDYGQIKETVGNLLNLHDLEQSGREPTEKEQIFQTSGPTESAPKHSVRLIQEEGAQGSQEKSDVMNGAEQSWRSLISSPHRASDKGLQFFQHSFLSSPENTFDVGANDSRQDNSQPVTEHLANIRHFLWSQLTDVRASLDREIMRPRRQKEHKDRAWQGGDIMETRHSEDGEATGFTSDKKNDVTNNVGTDFTRDVVTGVIVDATNDFVVDDDDLVDKGWMDRTLVDNLDNPKDEEPMAKRNRREYRSKKFGVLPFWWM